MYQDFSVCVSDKAKILVKEKDAKHFEYIGIKKLMLALDNKKELYSLDLHSKLHKIVRMEYLTPQDFFEIRTFTGSRILLGVENELYVDTFWVKVNDLIYHEKIYEWDFLKNLYIDSFITKIEYYGKRLAYQIYSEKDTGFIVNNILIRFDNEVHLDLGIIPRQPIL